jgi:hypothetical protein
LHSDDEDPAALLGVFEPLRRSNLALWAATTPEQRARIGRIGSAGRRASTSRSG